MGGRRNRGVRPQAFEDLALASGIYMAVIGDDVVVLDRSSDRYLCIPDAADTIIPIHGAVRVHPDVIVDLRQAGLLASGETPLPAPIPDRPERELPTASSRCRVSDLLAFGLAIAKAWPLGPTAPIETLIRALPPAPTAAQDLERIAALVGLFRAGLPWVPRQGACLYRAFLLLGLLRLAGQDATWVFGVRTWPFSAHCWLQVQDAVLDDDPERVAPYTPIMAV